MNIYQISLSHMRNFKQLIQTLIIMWVVIVALIGVSKPLAYDTYTFYPSDFYFYGSFPNTMNTGISLLSCNEDQMYMAVKGTLSTDSVEIYSRSTKGYQFLYTVIAPDVYNTYAVRLVISGADPQVILTITFNDNNLRLWTISKQRAVFRMTYSVGFSAQFAFTYYTAILLSSSTTTISYLWNNATQLYDPILTITDLAKNTRARAISPDGLYFLVDLGLGTDVLYLYTYFGSNYTQTASYTIPTVTTNVRNAFIVQEGSNYVAVIGFDAGGGYTTLRLTVTSTSITHLEQYPALVATYNSNFITSDGKHLILYRSSPMSLYFYSYDDMMGSYQLSFETNHFPSYNFNGQALYASSDGKFVAYGAPSSGLSNHIRVNLVHVYFTCDVPYCQRCSFLGICGTCSAGFVLNGSSCNCPVLQSLQRGVCISCNIPLCSSCSPADTCLGCLNGYVLISNACTCQPPRTVSLYSGFCVSCNVAGCQRCDYEDTCSSYSLSGQTSQTSQVNTSASSDSNSKDMLIFLVVAVGLLLLALIILVVCLLINMRRFQVHPLREPQPEVHNKNQLELNETNQKINSLSSELKIQEFVENEEPEQYYVSRQTKRRRVRQDKELDGISEVVSEIKVSRNITFEEPQA